MGLIKSNNAPVSVTTFSMADIEQQARAILLRAKQQSDQLRAAAETEGARIRQNAYDQGFTAGREDGTRKGREEGSNAGKQAALTEHRAKLEQLAKALSTAVADLDASRVELESKAGVEVLKLAIAIGRRATKLQGAADPNVLTGNVLEAMKLVVHSVDLRIAVHPAQHASLLETLPTLKLKWPSVTHVELVADETVAPGGCRIFTAQGEIDAELDAQVDRIARELIPRAQSVVDGGTAS